MDRAVTGLEETNYEDYDTSKRKRSATNTVGELVDKTKQTVQRSFGVGVTTFMPVFETKPPSINHGLLGNEGPPDLSEALGVVEAGRRAKPRFQPPCT